MTTPSMRRRPHPRERMRLLVRLALIGGLVSLAHPARGDQPAPFIHPGILVTRAQLDFVKAKITAGTEPWASAFARVKADHYGQQTYQPHPPVAQAATDKDPATTDGIVVCGSFSDPDVHCTHEKDDGVAAYTQALLWYFSGDEAYAQKAVEILNGWATLKRHSGFNTALQASWMGTQFARAAEIMQFSYPKWSAADVSAFKTMMRNTYLADLRVGLPGVARKGDAAYGQNGNWMLSIADNLIQIGVLLDDRGVFNQGVDLWRNRTPAYCYYSSWDGPHPALPCSGYAGTGTGYASTSGRTVDPYGYFGQAGGMGPAADPLPVGDGGAADGGADAGAVPTIFRMLPDGLSQETCRDIEHVQYGLAAMMNGAETARIQGVDLYREHLPEQERGVDREAARLGRGGRAGQGLRPPADLGDRVQRVRQSAASLDARDGQAAQDPARPTGRLGRRDPSHRMGDVDPRRPGQRRPRRHDLRSLTAGHMLGESDAENRRVVRASVSTPPRSEDTEGAQNVKSGLTKRY